MAEKTGNSLNFEENSSFADNDSRKRYIIARLLKADDFVRIEQIADELFVSRATVDRLMPELKGELQEYGLQIAARPKYGVMIRGSEIKKRLCYAHLSDRPLPTDQTDLTRRVQQIVLDVVERHELLINDINLYNFIRHCIVAIQRMAAGNQLTEADELSFDGPVEKETAAARELVTRFEAAFGIDIPEGEIRYMVMHLLGKRILRQPQALTTETLDCIDELLKEIREEQGLDFTGDAELYTALALHTQPMISRLRFGLKQKNPILQDIKRDMPQAYELAVCAVNVFRQRLGLEMSEDEAGYLAFHFAVAIDKKKEVRDSGQVLVVCASGRGTAKLLCHRLVERYHLKSENIILSSVFELKERSFDHILCAFTTVPLPLSLPVPVLQIDLTINDSTQAKIDDFMRSATRTHTVQGSLLPQNTLIFSDMTFSTREEVLDFLCAKLEKAFPALSEQGEFASLVKQREALSSTEVGNQLAMPHPYGYHGKVGAAAFLSLKKPLRWKFGTVRLVILLAIPENDPQMNTLMDALTPLATDANAVQILSRTLSSSAIEAYLSGGDKQ